VVHQSVEHSAVAKMDPGVNKQIMSWNNTCGGAALFLPRASSKQQRVHGVSK